MLTGSRSVANSPTFLAALLPVTRFYIETTLSRRALCLVEDWSFCWTAPASTSCLMQERWAANWFFETARDLERTRSSRSWDWLTPRKALNGFGEPHIRRLQFDPKTSQTAIWFIFTPFQITLIFACYKFSSLCLCQRIFEIYFVKSRIRE